MREREREIVVGELAEVAKHERKRKRGRKEEKTERQVQDCKLASEAVCGAAGLH